MAHITGGGIVENLPRALPEGLSFSLDRGSWVVPPVFQWLQSAGRVDDAEMMRTFNMGVGLILVCAPGQAAAAVHLLVDGGERAWILGEVT
jgi:phosphoribosylformylglycinamidine cyclo-ligase